MEREEERSELGSGRRGPGCTTETPYGRGLWPLVVAPGAAGDELGAGDEVACFEGFFDGGLVGLTGDFEGEPLGGQGVFVARCQPPA